MTERFRRRVSAPESGALGENEFEFRRGASGDERSDQSQRVLVEVGLEEEGEFCFRCLVVVPDIYTSVTALSCICG